MRKPPRAAYYESFYLKACHPDGGLGIWIRYTVHKRHRQAPTGFTWFTLFDSERGVSASKAPWPEPHVGDGDYIRLGENRFAPGLALGRAPSEQLDAAWELRFEGHEPPLWHLPARWMYRAPFPRTKVLTPHPQVTFDGAVQVGQRSIQVRGWPGTVGHNWGSEHAHRAIWLHGANFTGNRDVWLDLAIGRISVGPLVTPWIANGAVSLEGRRHRLGGLANARQTLIEETPEHCHFRLAGEGLVVDGAVQAPRERFVSWIYAQPRGGERQTVNCSIADMRVEVLPREKPPLVLECSGGAAYELQMSERYDAIAPQPFPDG